jgi:hypothetical protein
MSSDAAAAMANHRTGAVFRRPIRLLQHDWFLVREERFFLERETCVLNEKKTGKRHFIEGLTGSVCL